MLSCIPRTIATGQKQTFGLLGKLLPISHVYEFEQLEAMALGATGPQRPMSYESGRSGDTCHRFVSRPDRIGDKPEID